MRIIEAVSALFLIYLAMPFLVPVAVEAYKMQRISAGEYRCCLENPCNHCLLEHGNCDCLDLVVRGIVPCEECLGEIIEGEGNNLIKDRFPAIISKALEGESHD